MAISMELKLFGPGMTSLHKAGLAGLFMTLRSFEENNRKIDGLSWELLSDRIRLCWQKEKPHEAFNELVRESFKIDKDGFFRFPGLETSLLPTPEQKHLLYDALLNSFLQFGPHRKTKDKRILSYQINDKQIWIKDFAPINNFRHQDASKDFLNSHGFKKEIDIAGWLYPGGGQRHVVHNNSQLTESLEMALCLLFAPVGCIYFQIRSKVKGRKTRGAVLLPTVGDLEEYAEIRQAVASQGVIELTASGSSDAALRFLVLLKSQNLAQSIKREINSDIECRLITFGIVDWNEKQKSRTMTRSVFCGGMKGLNNYFYAHEIFKNRWQIVKAKTSRTGTTMEPERYFVATYTVREIIAENIATGKPWFDNFSTYFANKELRKQILYERKELNEMVNKADYEHGMERLFISTCHEAWRRQLGRLGERARRENALFSTLVNREAEKLRMSFARCRNAKDLRETVVDFWARSGPVKTLQESWHDILPLFDENSWRTAKDLALLALASYKPENRDEEEALSAIQINETEE